MSRTGSVAAMLVMSLVAVDSRALASQQGKPAPAGRGSAPSETAQIQQVRVALGRGQLADARRLADGLPSSAGRDLAAAIVDLFEGKNDAARAKLEPLARVNAGGEAALELGLLEMRTGQRRQGYQRLDVIASNRTFNSPDDYYRLARAAEGIREYKLAADAYTETAKVPRADIQASRGAMFLLRHRPGDAMADFKAALSFDAGWVPALLGVARALADENPEGAEAALNEVIKRAPNHPDLHILVAERALVAEDVAAAEAALDKAAAARANFLEEAALRAAVAYARQDTAAMDAAIARVRGLDPASALGWRRASEQAQRAYRFEEAANLARRGTTLDPDDPYAHFDLGQSLMRTGDEAGARTALERSWSLDDSSRLAKNLLDVLDSIAKFVTVTSGDFIFKFAPQEAAVLRTYAVPLVEEARATFTARYGFTPTGPILVEVFNHHDDFAVRTVGLAGLEGALGACFGKVVVMDSPSARPPGDFSWQATLWHELAHVYTLQMSKYRVPRWLTEGISVFEEHRRQPAWGREDALQFAAELQRGRTFGVKNLPGAFKNPTRLALAYFEASLLVEHLVELNGDAGLRTLLGAYAEGAKDAEAFAKAFGRSVDAVEASFKTFVDQRYGALARAMAEPPSRVAGDDLQGLRNRATQAPGNYISQMALAAALMKAGDYSGARAPLERAAALAPTAVGSGSPRALLSEVAERLGDTTQARKELAMLLASDHSNTPAARKLAALAGNNPAAADDRDFALRLIADVDPFDADNHSQLGRRLFAKKSYQTALIEFQAALALGPSNLPEAHTDLGETLFQVGRKEEAKRHVMLALQSAPTYARAQDVLLAILGRE
jgi:tetratricopeptide (TPR) repeat protein